MPADSDESLAPTLMDSSAGSGAPSELSTSEPLAPFAAIMEPDDALEETVGDRRYDLRGDLGAGGMGVVRLCRDRHVGRDVALKVLHRRHADAADLRGRFLREARVQGQLEHPAIVPVYDVGRRDDGEPYFVMRRVRGSTLEGVLEGIRAGDAAVRARFGRHALLSIFARVCLAIDYAHTRGVVHRDVKPSNVMIGDFGEVYLLDWGIAKLARTAGDEGAAAAEAVVLPPSGGETHSGATLGTPGYMSPEQAVGEPVDRRTDVYALGAMLYEILAEARLHGEGPAPVLLARTLGTAEAPEPAVELPPELAEACRRATARDREARYPTARELADVVERFLSGDRDLALRRDLAAVHVARATELAGRALASATDHAGREAALRELGSALALDPGHEGARALLVRVLTEPPAIPPPAVVAATRDAARAQVARVLPGTALTYLAIVGLILPFAFAAGMPRPALVAAPLALWTLAAAAAWLTARSPRLLASPVPYTTIATAIASAATSLLFGPWVLLPVVVAVNAMGYLLTAERGARGWAVGLSAAAFAVPACLAWVGLSPARFAFDAGGANGVTQALLFAVHAALLAGVIAFATRYKDALARAELRERLVAWQLEQLVPRGVLGG